MKFKNPAQPLSEIETNERKINKSSFHNVSHFEKKKIVDCFLLKSSRKDLGTQKK